MTRGRAQGKEWVANNKLHSLNSFSPCRGTNDWCHDSALLKTVSALQFLSTSILSRYFSPRTCSPRLCLYLPFSSLSLSHALILCSSIVTSCQVFEPHHGNVKARLLGGKGHIDLCNNLHLLDLHAD